MEKPYFEKDTVLLGLYWVGYNPRYNYYRVKGYTKSGAPRVVELKKEIVSQHATPVDSETVHRLSQPLVEFGPLYAARWSTKNNKWGITITDGVCKDRCSLEPYAPDQTYRENSYY